MSTRNERLNRRMRRLDGSGLAADKRDAQSDHGLGVERMLDALDWEVKSKSEKVKSAEFLTTLDHDLIQILNGVWLELIGLRHLVRTLDLICRHGRFRDESINELAGPARHRTRRKLKAAERLYERHRAELLAFFSAFDKSEPADLRRRHAEES